MCRLLILSEYSDALSASKPEHLQAFRDHSRNHSIPQASVIVETKRSTLSFPGRILGFVHAAEQFINGDHQIGAIGGRKPAQPLNHAGALAEHADAGVGIEQMGHGCLQVFYRRQLTLLWTLEGGVSDVDGIEESLRPCLWLRWLKHDGVAVLTDEDRRWQANALRQADRLTAASMVTFAVSMEVSFNVTLTGANLAHDAPRRKARCLWG